MTLRIGFDPTQCDCAHDMSNRLIPGSTWPVFCSAGVISSSMGFISKLTFPFVVVGSIFDDLPLPSLRSLLLLLLLLLSWAEDEMHFSLSSSKAALSYVCVLASLDIMIEKQQDSRSQVVRNSVAPKTVGR